MQSKKFGLRFTKLALIAFALAALGSEPKAAQSGGKDDELEIGQQVYDELKGKGEIIQSSPLYDQLRPIEAAVTKVAQPRYTHPFKFYLVHEPGPNAFA